MAWLRGIALILLVACARATTAPADGSTAESPAEELGATDAERNALACRGLYPKGDAELAEALSRSFERVVHVAPGAAQAHWKRLRVVPEKKGGRTIGVRVFWAPAPGEDADRALLGLCRLDLIEEANGTPVTLDSLRTALKDVGRVAETRIRVSRRGRTIVLVYRRAEALPD